MHDIDEKTITDQVLHRLKATPNSRVRELLASLVKSVHQFAREVRLTEEEWLEGMRFLVEAGQISSDRRHEVILLSDVLGLSQLIVAQNHKRNGPASDQTILGPFFVPGAPRKASHGETIANKATGTPLHISVEIQAGGVPVPGAQVDVWQANSDGEYDVQREGWTASSSDLRATFESDAAGRFSFWTIVPRSYPIPMDGPVGRLTRATKMSSMRPAHIHFIVRKEGFDPLVTHVFMDGDEFLEQDAVFGVRASCIGRYQIRPPGQAPDGRQVKVPYCVMERVLVVAEPASESL
jgi:hydroxyquinol 1,2-dioxygenase